MAKKSDNTFMYLGLGALAFFWLRSRNAAPVVAPLVLPETTRPPTTSVVTTVLPNQPIALGIGQSLPVPPAGYEWLPVVTGTQEADGSKTYVLQPIGAQRADPRYIGGPDGVMEFDPRFIGRRIELN